VILKYNFPTTSLALWVATSQLLHSKYFLSHKYHQIKMGLVGMAGRTQLIFAPTTEQWSSSFSVF